VLPALSFGWADALTPDGPATLRSSSAGAVDSIILPAPAVLTGWRATVGFGGKAGTVRLRARTLDGLEVLGKPERLPAAPGTYTFSGPRVHGIVVGIDQTTGGHAIVQPAGLFGAPDEHVPAIEAISARDVDLDLLADDIEDRTDLRLSAAAPGKRRVRVTLTNAGPLAADLPALGAASPTDHIPRGPSAPIDPEIGWAGCRSRTSTVWEWASLEGSQAHPCFPGRLPAGASRTFTLRVPARKPLRLTLTVAAEGPDLHAADNVLTVTR
jgi:hypothetical protein